MESVDAAAWRKSSYSGSNGGGCVEVGNRGDGIAVRDTTNRDGGALGFDPAAWRKFTDGIKDA